MNAALEISGLSIAYGDAPAAVSDVDLQVAPGEVLALVGESGSGKSTIAMAVARLLPRNARLTAGKIAVFGTVVPAVGDDAVLRQLRSTRLGYVFQNPITSLDPTMRVGRQLALAIPGAGRRDLLRVLEEMRIGEPEAVLRRFPHQLSGGMAQRVGLAMAIGRHPPLLIVDEPTSALDPSLAIEMFDLLLEQRQKRNAAILMLSHDLGAVARHADRVAVMQQGRVIESGATRQVFAAATHPYTQRLLQRQAVRPSPPAAGSGQVVARFDAVAVSYPAGFGRPPAAPALQDFSLEVREGEVLGIIGESGSGKTTVGRLLLGLLQPTSGTISIDGRPARQLPRGSIGAVLQNPDWALNPRLTVGAAVAEPLRVKGRLRRSERVEAVTAALARVGLSPDFVGRYPGQLSGGQRQRVSIARAMVAQPRLLLFDEPVSALDALVQRQVVDEIARLHRELGFTAIFISHDLGALRGVASRVAVLKGGRLLELADAATFFAGPAHAYSRQLLAASSHSGDPGS